MVSGDRDRPKARTRYYAMKNAWAVRIATDEVLETSVQLGVKNIIFYGGPGVDVFPASDKPLDKERNSYEDYVALRERIESYGLNVVGCENGFISNPKFYDIAFGGPKHSLPLRALGNTTDPNGDFHVKSSPLLFPYDKLQNSPELT